jgi:acyl-coenzyme A thioesterase PaaI-like protein
MNILTIPFVEKVGLQHDNIGLSLPFRPDNLNHIGTTHASAIFTLTETASGEALQKLFHEYAGKVIPVLRDSQVKFKKPATEIVHAFATVSDEDIQAFKTQLDKKGRALISVQIEVKDNNGTVVCVGTFTWFVQMIDGQ